MPLARRDTSDSSAGSADIAISSEFEVVRFGWLGERWVEILDHAPGAVVMDRAARGLAMLEEHDTRERVGKVENIRLDEDRVMRGTPRFSRNDGGQAAQRDFEDGILDQVSVGYRIHEYVLERSDKETNTEYYRITKWEPLEVSLVAVPADPTVGKGRTAVDGADPPSQSAVSIPPAKARAEGGNMEQVTKDAPAPAKVEARGDDTPMHKRLADLAQSVGMHDALPSWISRGVDMAEALREVKAEMDTRVKRGTQAIETGGADPLDISPKERRRFSIVNCVRAAVEKKLIDGYEGEVQEEFARKGFIPKNGGFLVPTRHGLEPLMTRATGQLDTATTLQGQQLVFTEPGSLIELFRNYAALLTLGARSLTGLVGNIAFPRQKAGGTASWTGEGPTADVSLSNLQAELLSMSPKTLMSATSISRQLATQAGSANLDVEALVRADIARLHALAIDSAGINGTGASNQPTGILTASNVNAVALGSNGAVPTFDHIVDMVTELAIDNAPDATGVLTTPGIAGKLMKTQKFATTNGESVWTGTFREGKVAPGYRAIGTAQVPSNLTKGTATTICHAIIAADFSELIFGEWGGFEIVADPYTLLGRNLVRLVSYQTADIGLRHVESFVRTVDARTS